MPHSAESFPPEIFDRIIDHLHEDHSALRICSLVCRSWLPSSRLHLFHSIDEVALENSGLHLLQNSSYLTKFVRGLRLDEKNIRRRERCSTRSFSLTMIPNLPPVLRTLPHITHFELHNIYCNWQTSSQFRDAIQAVFRSPSLSHVDIRYCRFNSSSEFAALIRSATNLQSLTLLGVTCYELEDVGVVTAEPPTTPSQLRYFHGQVPSSAPGLPALVNSDWLLYPPIDLNLDITRLQELRLAQISEDATSVNQLLLALGDSLKRLTIDNGYNWYRVPGILDLTYNRCLCFFRVIHIFVGSDFFKKPLAWAESIFDNISSPHLEEIVMEITVMGPTASRSSSWRDWSAIDKTLARHELASLRRVDLKISIAEASMRNPTEPPGFQGMLQDVRQQFKVLHGRGLLTVH